MRNARYSSLRRRSHHQSFSIIRKSVYLQSVTLALMLPDQPGYAMDRLRKRYYGETGRTLSDGGYMWEKFQSGLHEISRELMSRATPSRHVAAIFQLLD